MKVLAVDDSRTIREIIRTSLEREGIDVELAIDGEDGLAVLDTLDPPPNAILTDVNMPNLDGFGFLEAVRSDEAYERIPVLVLTTETAQELRSRARASGATGWLVKPFDPARLVGALRTVATSTAT
jgi:two-component system chemotaxis response regulator CheY